MSALDEQIGGNHYKKYSYQPIQFFMDLNLSPAIHSAIKYLTRIGVDKDKNNIGIEKAKHYLRLFEEHQYSLNFHRDYICTYSIYSPKITQFVMQFEPKIRNIILNILELDIGNYWSYSEINTNGEVFSHIDEERLGNLVKNICIKLDKLKVD